jgi:hypothetical protein
MLDRAFPEYDTLFSSVFLTSSRALLKEAATAQEIADFDLAELTDLLQKTSCGRFGAQGSSHSERSPAVGRGQLPRRCGPRRNALSVAASRPAAGTNRPDQ